MANGENKCHKWVDMPSGSTRSWGSVPSICCLLSTVRSLMCAVCSVQSAVLCVLCVIWGVMSAVCCVLSAVCYLLSSVWSLLFVAWSLIAAVYYLLSAIVCMLYSLFWSRIIWDKICGNYTHNPVWMNSSETIIYCSSSHSSYQLTSHIWCAHITFTLTEPWKET